MSDENNTKTDAGTQRLDKWLWYTRLVKSRTLAAGLVSDGKVRLNRLRVEKPSHAVRIGDVVTATINRRVWVVRVVAPGTRRGPALEARQLYEDLSEPIVETGTGQSNVASAGQSQTGRPNKRERREITAMKRRETS